MRFSIRLAIVLPLLVAAVGHGKGAESTADGGGTDSPAEQALKVYVQSQLKEIRRIAQEKNLEIAPEYQQLILAAEQSDWGGVTNAYRHIALKLRQQERDPSVANALRTPSLELCGAVQQFLMWTPGLIDRFATDVVKVISTNAIYFGGTDHGRFVMVTYGAASDKPFYVITQNALADNQYLAYERGDPRNAGIWLPGEDDSRQAFQQYVQGVKAGSINAGADVKTENGKVQVQGVAGVMQINGFITKQIFDHNKDGHEFFVEESYTLPWMYPYLEPCGPIMKINAEPTPITPEMVARDQAYWDGCIAELLADPAYKQDLAAQRAFSKLRSSIAGLYAARGKFPEAENAFRQSIELYPDGPEAHYRLADLLARQGRRDEAVALFEPFMERNPEIKNAATFLDRLRNDELAAKPNRVAPSTGGASSKGSFEQTLKDAEGGNAQAMLKLARMYDAGKGVKRNFKTGFEWRMKAAEQGSAEAQNGVAANYIQGKGTPVDYEAALEWRMKAVKQGLTVAMVGMGEIYEQGKGVEQDYSMALQWYLKGAKQGGAKALESAGRFYYEGLGTEKNSIKAYAFSKLSTLERAQTRLDDISKEMTPAQIEAGDKLAEQLKTAIEQNKAEQP